jgi:hypothetical protein
VDQTHLTIILLSLVSAFGVIAIVVIQLHMARLVRQSPESLEAILVWLKKSADATPLNSCECTVYSIESIHRRLGRVSDLHFCSPVCRTDASFRRRI